MLWYALHHECRGHQEESGFGHGGGHLHPRRAEKPDQRCVIIVFFFCCVVSVVFSLFQKNSALTMLLIVCGSRFLANSHSHFDLFSSAPRFTTLFPSGLATYNILQNPKYKEQFAITWKFAMNNNSVRSVRNNKARAHIASDETDADKMEVRLCFFSFFLFLYFLL